MVSPSVSLNFNRQSRNALATIACVQVLPDHFINYFKMHVFLSCIFEMQLVIKVIKSTEMNYVIRDYQHLNIVFLINLSWMYRIALLWTTVLLPTIEPFSRDQKVSQTCPLRNDTRLSNQICNILILLFASGSCLFCNDFVLGLVQQTFGSKLSHILLEILNVLLLTDIILVNIDFKLF